MMLTITGHGPDYIQLDSDTAGAVSGRKLIPGSVDVLMGTAVVPLHSLLTHRTGRTILYFSQYRDICEWGCCLTLLQLSIAGRCLSK